jgi:hypothetical protein
MTHLNEPSVEAVRSVLADLAPELVELPIEIRPAINVRPQCGARRA